jgi:O-antigen ligase
VRARALEGVNDIRSYLAGGSTYTNLGVRFEMWRGAAMLVAERPWLGSAQGQAMAQLAAQADAGRFEPAVKQAGHFHNDALQALVTGGVIGLLAWLATLLAPLVFFVRLLRAHVRAGAVNPGLLAPALAGTLVVVSYAGFGLTEVIFWSMRASLLYALLVFLLMGLCLNAKEIDGK